MDYITRDKLIELIKDTYPDGEMPIVGFRVKGVASHSTRQINHPWSHSWNQRVNRDKLQPFKEEL